MAQRRMFSKKIVETDRFLDMPVNAKLLYFYLNMNADDDGFVGNPKMIKAMSGATDDDLKILIAKQFIFTFESGVVVIKDWLIHNFIRKDRYDKTAYQEEKSLLETGENGSYQRLEGRLTIGQPNVIPTVDPGKDRLGKDRLGKDSKYIDQTSLTDRFETLWKMYPRKSGKKQSFEIYKRAIKKGVTDDEIEQGIENYLQQIKIKGTPTQYIKQGSTWFRNEGWNDEYDYTPERPVNGKQPRVIEHRPVEWTDVPNDDDIIPDFEI